MRHERGSSLRNRFILMIMILPSTFVNAAKSPQKPLKPHIINSTISSSSENVWNEWSDDDGTPSNESGVLDETLHERHCSGESEALFCFLIVDAVPAGLYSVSDLHGSEHCIPGYSSRFPSDVSTLCTFNYGFSLCYKQVPYCTDLYKSSSSP